MLLFGKFDLPIYGFSCILIMLIMIYASVVDIRTYTIPNKLTLSILVLSVIQMLIACLQFDSLEPLGQCIGGFLIGLVFIGLVIFITKGGIGGGDMKLYASLGAFFGVKMIIEILCLSFVFSGLISAFLIILKLKKLDAKIAMAPYITIAAAVVILFQQYIDLFLIHYYGIR